MTVTFLCCLQSTTKSSMNMFLVFAILFQLLFAVHSFADMWNITCADNGTVVTCCSMLICCLLKDAECVLMLSNALQWIIVVVERL
ncbi:unnamed protein product [Heterobilharzia americana]|nr:unnamed protein product [Heterobilharzia americana]